MDDDRTERIERDLRRTLTDESLTLAPDAALAGRVERGMRRTRGRRAGAGLTAVVVAGVATAAVLVGGTSGRAVDVPVASPTPSASPSVAEPGCGGMRVGPAEAFEDESELLDQGFVVALVNDGPGACEVTGLTVSTTLDDRDLEDQMTDDRLGPGLAADPWLVAGRTATLSVRTFPTCQFDGAVMRIAFADGASVDLRHPRRPPSDDRCIQPGPMLSILSLDTDPAETTVPPDPDTEPTSAELAAQVALPTSTMAGVRVDRTGSTLTVSTVWEVQSDDPDAAGDPRRILASSDDGFATATYRVLRSDDYSPLADDPPGADAYDGCADVVGGTTLCTYRDGTAHWTDDEGRSWDQAPLPGLDGLLVGPVPSLRAGTYAAVGGSDGATLSPFEAVARSTDAGGSFTPLTLPRFDGALAFTSGEVVLSDGRLLALLNGFTDDDLDRLADRHHGLWVSDGDDWTSYSPLEPTFSPPLDGDTEQALDGISAGASPDPVLWTVAAATGRLYVSTDDAATFTEVATR